MAIEISQAEMPSLILLSVLLAGTGITIYLSLKSGDKYSVEDSERDAISFAGVINEAQGPMTTFLIVAFIVLIVWAVVYLVLYL
ncbi:MAG: hypothetical protein O8C64_09245 [Candidatus Methanoperedens sp.]|nr:hypothetical protein [Candidatus Methanoperedens sp.]